MGARATCPVDALPPRRTGALRPPTALDRSTARPPSRDAPPHEARALLPRECHPDLSSRCPSRGFRRLTASALARKRRGANPVGGTVPSWPARRSASASTNSRSPASHPATFPEPQRGGSTVPRHDAPRVLAPRVPPAPVHQRRQLQAEADTRLIGHNTRRPCSVLHRRVWVPTDQRWTHPPLDARLTTSRGTASARRRRPQAADGARRW